MSLWWGGKKYLYEAEKWKELAIYRVAKEYDILPADLLALCFQESHCKVDPPGSNDFGHSKGAFQIHSQHGAPDSIRGDLALSAQWAAEKLKNNGYQKNYAGKRRYAFWRYNGVVPTTEERQGNEWYPARVMALSNSIHNSSNFFNYAN